MVAGRWLWRVWPELGLRPGKLEKTTRPPGRDVEEVAGSTNGEFTPEVPAGDTDRGVINALKVFIAPRLNETTKGAATLKTRGSGREPRAIPQGNGLLVQTGVCIRAQQAAGGRVERQVGRCKLLFGLQLFPSKTNGSGLPWPLAAAGALFCRRLPGLGHVWKADRGVLLGETREGSEGGRWAAELPCAVIATEASAVP